MTGSKEGDIMTAIIQICLWFFLLVQISELIAPIKEIIKRRSRLRKLVKKNMRLSENADSDYKAGFFYGQAKLYEKELNETRLFDNE